MLPVSNVQVPDDNCFKFMHYPCRWGQTSRYQKDISKDKSRYFMWRQLNNPLTLSHVIYIPNNFILACRAVLCTVTNSNRLNGWLGDCSDYLYTIFSCPLLSFYKI